MKTLALAVATLAFLVVVSPTYAQEPHPYQFPKDGNGLLDYCSQLVDLFDHKLSSSADETKIGWCDGYIQASTGFILHLKINLYLASMAGVTLSGPEKAKLIVTQLSDMCIPDGASILQEARVIVKWLRDHPERLHEPPDFLTLDALKDAFPCPVKQPIAPK